MPLAYPPLAPVAPERTAEDLRNVMHQYQRSLAATIDNLPQTARDIQANFAGVVSRLDAEDVPAFGMACYASFAADKETLLPKLAEFLSVIAEGLTLPDAPVTAATLAGELLAIAEGE